jgi:hypothetical protein
VADGINCCVSAAVLMLRMVRIVRNLGYLQKRYFVLRQSIYDIEALAIEQPFFTPRDKIPRKSRAYDYPTTVYIQP